MEESGPTVLYSTWGSSCAYRVRICLNLKNVQHEIKQVNLAKFEDESFENVNPMKYVPVLLIDGHTLIESMAIMEYLDETRSENPLLPSSALKRAQVRAICGIVVSGIQPLQNTGVLDMIGNHLGEKEKAWSQHWIVKGFTAIEKLLTVCAGKYCVGDNISLADCCLVPQVFNARRFEVDLEPFPTIRRIDLDLNQHPAFKLAHPILQSDFPVELLTNKSFFHAIGI